MIDQLIMYAALGDNPGDVFGWTAAADVIDPAQWYTVSFDAKPDCSVTRWFPPEGSGLASVIRLLPGGRNGRPDQAGSYSGPSSRS